MNEECDKRRYKLLQQFRAVMDNLLMEEEYDELVAMQNELSYPAIARYGEDQYFQFQEINAILNRTRIHVETLPEYSFLLQLAGLQGKDLEEVLSHENAHMNVAESFNAIVHGYVLDISLAWHDDKKAYILQPAADVDLPCDWSDQTKRIVSKLLALAPQFYGDAMSDGDIMLVQELETLKRRKNREPQKELAVAYE